MPDNKQLQKIPTATEYSNFKHILEYFVAHMEYAANRDKTFAGYNTYIRPLEENGTFKFAGKGYDGHQIQQQVSAWSEYSVGVIAMNCTPQFGGNYRTRLCYLNWIPTGLNVNAQWKDKHISALMLQNYVDTNTWTPVVEPISLDEFGLYDGNEPNDKVKSFLDSFFIMKIDYNHQEEINAMKEQLKTYTDVLEKNYNLILTGAPGTGKTFLAKQIAQMMTGDIEAPPAEKSHIAFVQFHPTYDYSDFVEGLRPTPPDENGNIGFTRQDGIFKSFCKRAIRSTQDNGQDNFETSWQKLVDTLNEKDFINVPNLSGKGEFEIELNEYGTGLASRTYASADEKAKHNWTNGRSKFFSKDQLYKVYQGLPGVPNGGHDNYRRAVINLMKKDYGLSEYNAGVQNNGEKQNYVFIIDEINRGDIAKIFGELFFALDPGYRGEKGRVETQYTNLIDENDIFKYGFYIPENVYIIGTMNDIDRNVESMDFAIRRRFTWMEIEPENSQGMWDDPNHGITEYKDSAAKYMGAINKAISRIQGLGKAYQLGASYFLKLKEYEGDFGKLWEYHIQPLLNEYLRGLPNAETEMKELIRVWKSVQTPAGQPEAEPIEGNTQA